MKSYLRTNKLAKLLTKPFLLVSIYFGMESKNFEIFISIKNREFFQNSQ